MSTIYRMIPLTDEQINNVVKETEECMDYFMAVANIKSLDKTAFDVLDAMREEIVKWNIILTISK